MSEEPNPDELAAAKSARAEDPAWNARQWLLDVADATLCTLSAKPELDGYPFGSVVPFALSADGTPFIYIARIAAHTAALKRDPRASLFVRQPGLEGDPQKGWRITVMGRMKKLVPENERVDDREADSVERVSADTLVELHARYGERVRWAETYGGTHDFCYWRMSHVEKVRYIAGFGKICWLDGEEVLRAPMSEGFAEAAPGALAHMNEDHVENMKEMCAGRYGVSPAHVEMVSLDRTGFQLQCSGPDRRLHFSFGREISADDIRRAVIEVLARAREASAQGAADHAE